MKNRDGSAVTGCVNPAESRIELNYIRSISHRQKRNRLVFVEIEYGHQIVFFTREKHTVMLGIERHAVVSFAPSNRVSSNHLVGRRIDDGKDVLILQVDVHFAGYRV